jgi:hypothetical protein
MQTRYIIGFSSLLVGAVAPFVAFTTPAQAASFTPFSFTTGFTGSPPDGDIFLKSVTAFDGSVLGTGKLSLVTGADIIQNDPVPASALPNNLQNFGAASADKGTAATTGVRKEDPTNADIVANLGNFNLNNIIDTEDKGKFTIDVSFSKAVDQFFFWERGQNSKLKVQALGADDSVLADYTFDSSKAPTVSAGYSILTTEKFQAGDGPQAVGAIGLKLSEGSVSKLRLISEGRSFNGPDFKVIAGSSSTTSVPEPLTLGGLSLIAGTLLTTRRRKASEQIDS